MRQRIWVQGQVLGLVVGGVVTTLMLTLYLSGRLDRLVLTFLDVNFRHFNRVEVSDRILMIDIDNHAVDRIHRWPWPRRLHAELIATLNELGAEVIVMDFVFPEPMSPRFQDARYHRDYDVDPATKIVGESSADDLVFDDDELVTALKAGGNVYLGMYYESAPPDRPIGQLRRTAAEVFRNDPKATIETFRRALPYDPGRQTDGSDRQTDDRDRQTDELYHHYRMRNLLVEDFTLTDQRLAERLNTTVEEIRKYLGSVKRSVARELATRVIAESPEILNESPEAGFAGILARTLPPAAEDRFSADRQDVLRAYRSILAHTVVVQAQPAVPASMSGRLEQALKVTPPLDKLSKAARGVGFVTFEKDFDAVLRRVPLVINADGHLVKHLGLVVACDLLGLDDERFGLDGDQLVLPDADGEHELRVPIDRQGRTLLNWHLDREHRAWEYSFEHRPVTRVMEIVFNRRDINENRTRYGIAVAGAVKATQGPRYPQYATSVRRRNEIRRRLRFYQGRHADNRPKLLEELESLDESIARNEKAALDMLQWRAGEIKQATPESEEEAAQFERIASLHKELIESGKCQDWESKNARLRASNAELLESLRRDVAGKICFVGYTATATADLVNTPVYDTVPGVLGHANVVNSFLQAGFPRVASRTMNVLLILLAGVLVTLVTARRGPWAALVCVLATIAFLMTCSFALFWGGAVYVAAVVPALTVFVCWAFITLYRQLIEQRAKRQFSKALAQYTSPAVAARIAKQQGAQDLSPRPCEVTCFFSDLQGFTAISERLGAERTRAILNPYLEAMSGVLNDHRAIINKFMGDGIFAFFNPPILQVPDHAAAACAAALDSMVALDRLKSELAGPLGPDAAALQMRVGINSGYAFVGDYGSVNKLDFTCIGDAVNLAARLEPANKVFGTWIMISAQTRRQAGNDFEFRSLGSLQVLGKQEAVPVYELLGRYGEVDDARRRYAELFARAVGLFQDRRWADAAEALNACGQEQPDDLAVRLYLDHIDRYRNNPPPDDWNRGIELTAK